MPGGPKGHFDADNNNVNVRNRWTLEATLAYSAGDLLAWEARPALGYQAYNDQFWELSEIAEEEYESRLRSGRVSF